MGHELLDLIGLDGDEALVAAVLAVLLLEHDARYSPRLTFLGGDVLAGGGAWYGPYGLGILGVRFGEVVEDGDFGLYESSGG